MEVKVIRSNPTYIENMFDEAEMGLINVSNSCFSDTG